MITATDKPQFIKITLLVPPSTCGTSNRTVLKKQTFEPKIFMDHYLKKKKKANFPHQCALSLQ